MLFTFTFEIGILVIGFLYVVHLYVNDIIDLLQVTNDIEESDKEKKEFSDMAKRLYS